MLQHIFTNRGSTLFSNAYKTIQHLITSPQKFIITYYDSRMLSQKKVDELIKNGAKEEDIFHIMDDSHTWRIDDKREFARLMRGSRYNPLCFLDYNAFVKVKDKYPEDKLWFIKSRGGTGGRAVTCSYTKDIIQNPGNNFVIQEGISSIDLWNNRKYVIRSYIFIWNKQAWLHKKAWAMIHGKDYVENSVDFDIQINHNGYCNASATVKVFNLESIRTLNSKHKNTYEKITSLLYSSSKDLCGRFKDMIEKSTERRFILLGIDNLIIKNGGNLDLRFVEVNRFPNICHTHEVNRDVNEIVITDILKKFYNIETPFGSGFVPL